MNGRRIFWDLLTPVMKGALFASLLHFQPAIPSGHHESSLIHPSPIQMSALKVKSA